MSAMGASDVVRGWRGHGKQMEMGASGGVWAVRLILGRKDRQGWRDLLLEAQLELVELVVEELGGALHLAERAPAAVVVGAEARGEGRRAAGLWVATRVSFLTSVKRGSGHISGN